MRYRNVELYYEQSLDNTGTKIFDLKTTDPISAIRLDFKGTNGETVNQNNLMNDVISNIELVDGSDQLTSLNLKQAQALHFFDTRKTPLMRIEERASGSINEQCLILFGRYLWDKEYYLDLKKFTNPQLKITTAGLTPNALAVGGFLDGSFKVTINLHVIEDGAVESKGFMMRKEVYSFTGAASGDEHIDMPQDYPYVGLLIRAYEDQKDFHENITDLKISCDAGKFIPVDKKCHDLIRMNEEDYGPLELRMQLCRAGGDKVRHPLHGDPIAVLQADQHNNLYQAIYQWSGYFDLEVTDHEGVEVTTDSWIRALIKGVSLHSTLFLPFGILSDPTTYFDPKLWTDIELILTQAGDWSPSNQIILQQLRSY